MFWKLLFKSITFFVLFIYYYIWALRMYVTRAYTHWYDNQHFKSQESVMFSLEDTLVNLYFWSFFCYQNLFSITTAIYMGWRVFFFFSPLNPDVCRFFFTFAFANFLAQIWSIEAHIKETIFCPPSAVLHTLAKEESIHKQEYIFSPTLATQYIYFSCFGHDVFFLKSHRFDAPNSKSASPQNI